MTGTFTARAALLLLLAVIALGAGLLWWLLNHPELTRTSPGQPKPPAQAERSAPPAPAETLKPKSITEATEAIKDLGGQIGAAKPAAPDPAPQFDVARIEPSGDSVIAGRAAPNATVELLRDGEVHDRTVADATGSFVLIPKPLPPGKYELKLRMTEPGGKPMVSSQSVAVELGSPAQDKAVATLAPSAPPPPAPQPQPAGPSETPAAAQPKPAPAPQVEANVRIDLAEAQDGGKLYVSGRSAPGASVRLYLNDAFIATGTASADGQVSFFIGGGVKPGEYRIRLDQLGETDKVVARAEVPFSAPATLASSAPASSAPASGSATAPSAPGSSAPQTVIAAAQPQQAAPAPQASAPASPSVTTDVKPQGQAERPASQPTASDTKPAGAAQPPATRTASGGPAATPPQQAPTQQRSATYAAPQGESAASAGTVSPAIASAAPGKTPSTQAQTPSASIANDSKARPETATPQKSAATTDRGNTVVVPNIDTRVVIRGDNLWRISRTTYGHGLRYTVIYKANRDQIRDPDLIYPGQIFVLPKAR